ncbi:alpha/beta-Hydrolases superfamily protein [Perilla frutescens var. frutescens]|nr:alpha/beta-Hydrolases superfamily protein [Perilla frutescens var. frutescens]
MSENQQHQPHKSPVVENKKVVIENSYGEKLVGILHETGSSELVIICHGFRSSKDRIPMVNIALAFEREGISAFRFDFAGNGESEGSFQYGNYRREAQDLRAVVEHFQAKERRIVAIIGHSKGGNAVLLYASRYNDIQTIVNIAGRFNLRRGIEGRLGKDFEEKIKQHGFIDVKNRRGKTEYRVTEKSLMDRLETDTRAACQTIPQSCRVLTVHATLDEMVPVEDATEFAKFIPNHSLCIVEGADHEFTKHQSELNSIVLSFVKACLHKHEVSSSPCFSCCRTKQFIDSRL